MKSALITGLNQLEIREIPDPVLPPGGVIVKMVSAAICGTDVKMLLNGHRDLVLPRIPGHEGAGVVIETDNESFKTGDVVAVYPGIYCGKCLNCLDGNTSRCDSIRIYGFNQDGLFRGLVPFNSNEISSLIHVTEKGNTGNIALAEPLACCISAMNKVSVKKGSALIIGAGSVGVIFASLLLARGFHSVVIADRSEEKLTSQCPVNAKVIVSEAESLESKLMAEGVDAGFDLIVPCCPDGLKWGFTGFMKPGGSVLFFSGNNRGVESNRVDMNEVHYKELVLAGSYGCNLNDFRDALNMIVYDEIDLSFLIPHYISLEEMPGCVEILKKNNTKKVIIKRF
ncbi:MAG: alcohol dehydrogenase catalytic domain-containing protein [Deltaproteobacteria bacterium]|nr:alcohol dehydrogenase catalytic domain-containing protein [Deltaproteobacteria bacterium]